MDPPPVIQVSLSSSKDQDNDEVLVEDGEKVKERNIIHHTLNPLILVASIVEAGKPSAAVGTQASPTAGASNLANNISISVTNPGNSMPTIQSGSLYNSFTSKQQSLGGAEFENLVGTTSVVANMVSDKNLDKESPMKAVFVFSNLSVKQDGNYRLVFTLYEFATYNSLHSFDSFTPPAHVPNYIIKRASIESDTFKVYTAKKFPGLTTSSKLSFDLKSSGTKIKVRHSIRSGKKQVQPKLEAINQVPEVEINTVPEMENLNGNNINDDNISVNSFATNYLGDYSSMTPIFSTNTTSSTSSLQSTAHSFGSFFSLRHSEVSPLKLLSDVSSQQTPISIPNSANQREDSIIPSPPGSPKVDNGSTTTISNISSPKYGHQSQDSLSSIHTRHSNLSISNPTSLYFSTPASQVKVLLNKRSDQYLNKDEAEDKLLAVPPKKTKTDRSNQYKNAIMKIQNIIN